MLTRVALRWILLSTVMILILALLGCVSSTPSITPFPTLPYTPTPNTIPEFLVFVVPRPGDWSATGYVETSIGARVQVSQVVESGETLDLYAWRERVQLLVDGQRLDVELKQVVPGQIQVSGEASLELGEHEATIRVSRTSGATLTYTWRFTVVRGEPSIPGLPTGFQFVRPLPDSTITRQAYREGHLVPSYYLPGLVHLEGGVCVGIQARKVVEVGEFVEGEDIARKYTFVALDGVAPSPDIAIEGGWEADIQYVYDQTGQKVLSYGGTHNYKCLRVDLASGRHEVTVRLERASGQVTEFTWWFVITE